MLKLTCYGVRVEVPGSFCDIKKHGDKLSYPGWQFADEKGNMRTCYDTRDILNKDINSPSIIQHEFPCGYMLVSANLASLMQ